MILLDSGTQAIMLRQERSDSSALPIIVPVHAEDSAASASSDEGEPPPPPDPFAEMFPEYAAARDRLVEKYRRRRERKEQRRARRSSGLPTADASGQPSQERQSTAGSRRGSISRMSSLNTASLANRSRMPSSFGLPGQPMSAMEAMLGDHVMNPRVDVVRLDMGSEMTDMQEKPGENRLDSGGADGTTDIGTADSKNFVNILSGAMNEDFNESDLIDEDELKKEQMAAQKERLRQRFLWQATDWDHDPGVRPESELSMIAQEKNQEFTDAIDILMSRPISDSGPVRRKEFTPDSDSQKRSESAQRQILALMDTIGNVADFHEALSSFNGRRGKDADKFDKHLAQIKRKNQRRGNKGGRDEMSPDDIFPEKPSSVENGLMKTLKETVKGDSDGKQRRVKNRSRLSRASVSMDDEDIDESYQDMIRYGGSFEKSKFEAKIFSVRASFNAMEDLKEKMISYEDQPLAARHRVSHVDVYIPDFLDEKMGSAAKMKQAKPPKVKKRWYSVHEKPETKKQAKESSGLCCEKECKARAGFMISCEGECGRSWHVACIKDPKIAPTFERDERWLCGECRTIIFPVQCIECKKEDIPKYMRKCGVSKCGKYIHESCSNATGRSQQRRGKLVCPNHKCAMCRASIPETMVSFNCTKCSNGFHRQCFQRMRNTQKVGVTDVVCPKHDFPFTWVDIPKGGERVDFDDIWPDEIPDDLTNFMPKSCGGLADLDKKRRAGRKVAKYERTVLDVIEQGHRKKPIEANLLKTIPRVFDEGFERFRNIGKIRKND